MHLLPLYLPFMLSLRDMDRLGVYLDNHSNKIIHKESGNCVGVTWKWRHALLVWLQIQACYYTEQDLRNMHIHFGHPSVSKLRNVLKRASGQHKKKSTHRFLEKIQQHCDYCQHFGVKPERLKFTLLDDVVSFNDTIYCDILTIEKLPVLHVGDEAKRFQAAHRLENMKTEELWNKLKMCWINVYLGPPDIITHDAASNFVARAFQRNADFLHIRCKEVLIEVANRMSLVERYHAPLRRAFGITREECPGIPFDDALLAVVKGLNNSTGPDNIFPTLLVFGAMTRLGTSSDTPHRNNSKRERPSISHRRMTTYFVRRQVGDASKQRNGPEVLN